MAVSATAGRWFRAKLADAGVVTSGDPEAAIADVTVTGTYATDDNAIELAINSIIAVLVAKGLIEEA